MSRLGRLATTISGVGFPPTEQGKTEGDLPLLKVSDLADPRNAGGVLTAANWITNTQASRLGVRRVPPGSIIFPKVGAALLGNARALTKVECALDNNMMAIAPTAGDARYWLYVLRTVDLGRLNMSGTLPFVSDSAVRDLDLPLDRKLEEQRQIADFLDDQVARIDNIIIGRRDQMTFTAEMRGSRVIDLLLMGGDLRGSSDSFWYRGLPDDLPVRPLRSAWQVIDCKHRTPDYVDDGFPVVSPGDISPAPLDLGRCHRFVGESDYADLADPLRRCRVGDIVYSRNASAGTAALVTTDAPFTMGQDVCRITSRRDAQTYLYYVLNFAATPQLNAARVGSTFTRINIDEIKGLRVPVPAEADQDRIARAADDVVARYERALTAQRQQVERLDELKRSLITAAVTGRFDVSSADGSRVPA